MTSILQLPEEILFAIFEDFDFYELRECQIVCRAWYRPAHLKFLKEVDVYQPLEIEQFIVCIDANPNQEYLNAVQTIRIHNTTESGPVQYRLSKENTAKLFFRFPNLQEIQVTGDLILFDNFDDELCETFWEELPKLKAVEVQQEFMDELVYDKILHKIRYLLTKLHIRDTKQAERFGSVQNLITSFPRLRNVGDFIGHLDSFRKFLPVFEKLPQLEHLALYMRAQDDIDYSDTYIEDHPSIADTLSNITHLDLLIFIRGISSESFDFYKKYFTGLIVLTIGSCSSHHWTDVQQTLFCENTLDLALFVKNLTTFRGWIDFKALSKCLPTMIQKVFRRVPPPYTNKAQRALHIELSSKHANPKDMAFLNIEWWRLKKLIKIAVKNKPSLAEITSDILDEASPILDVDSFTLDIEKRGQLHYYNREATMEMYDDILGRMPQLKEVFLDVPLSFVETTLTPDQYKVLSKMEDVTIKATADAKIQTLLDGFFYSFPNIRTLSIYYLSGIWKKDLGEFQLDLPRYDLETLVLDVTSVRRKMKCVVDKKCFVLEVEFLSNSTRCLYMVSTKDLSFEEIIDLNDLHGLARGKDYYRVNIKINYLRKLKLRMSNFEYHDEKEDYNLHNDPNEYRMDEVTIFSEDADENWLLMDTNNENRIAFY